MKQSKLRLHFHFSLLLTLLFCFHSSASAAEKAPHTNGLIRVPVFFITDRNLQPSKLGKVDFGPHRKYIGDCQHDPFMGKAYCVVENTDNKTINAHLKDLGWAETEAKDKLGAFKATPLTEDNFQRAQTEFYEDVHAKALLCPDKNVLMFAHGYNNSFVAGLHTAAKLAYNAERPLILYSWPSVGKLRSYNTDETNVEWSQDHYNDVLAHLEQLCKEDPSVKVRLLAHSMGTRLLVRAIPVLREKPYVLEAVVICPDVDHGLVQHYIRRYISASGTAKMRVYLSRHDKALAFSQLVHGGYTRLGEQADALGAWITKTLTSQNANTDKIVTKTEDTVLSGKLAENSKRMQTIDFTNIDKGFIGHNVPAKLVCDMSFTDTPTPGLELISERSGMRSGLSNFFSKLTKMKPSGGTSLTGDVWHVVTTADAGVDPSVKKEKESKTNKFKTDKPRDSKVRDIETEDPKTTNPDLEQKADD